MEEHPHHKTMKDVESLDNINVQINSIGTRLEEMTLANDGLLISLKWRIEIFKEDFKASMQLLRGQYEKMMAFLKA